MAAATDGGRNEVLTKGPVVLLPFMVQGHLIPFLHFARLLHSRSSSSPPLPTPTPPLLPPALRFTELLLPTTTSSPLAAESTDSLSRPQKNAFYDTSVSLLFQPFTTLFGQLHPPPSCVVSDMFLAWAADMFLSDIYSLAWSFTLFSRVNEPQCEFPQPACPVQDQ